MLMLVSWQIVSSILRRSILLYNPITVNRGALSEIPGISTCTIMLIKSITKSLDLEILSAKESTLKRNRNVTVFQWKIHGVLFKVLDGDNESRSFQEMLMDSTIQCLK